MATTIIRTVLKWRRSAVIDERRTHFDRWWRKNHSRKQAHHWLAYHARRIAQTYCFGPELFDYVQTLTRAFFKSQYRKLSKTEAWELWRLTHPGVTERTQRLREAGEYYAAKRELSKKATETTKKKFTVEVKRRHVINR